MFTWFHTKFNHTSKKLSKILRLPKNDFHIIYMDGAFNFNVNEIENKYAYWIFDIENPLQINWNSTISKIYYLENSLNKFIELINQYKHIDGLIGFSQGGCFCDYICKLVTIGTLKINLKFVIFIAARHFDYLDYFIS